MTWTIKRALEHEGQRGNKAGSKNVINMSESLSLFPRNIDLAFLTNLEV